MPLLSGLSELFRSPLEKEAGITTRNLEKFVRDVCRIPSPAPTPEQFFAHLQKRGKHPASVEFQFLNVVLQQKYGTTKLPIDPELFLQHAKNLLTTERVVPHEEWVKPHVGSNKSLLHSRIAYSQILVLQELLLWGGFERATPRWRKMSQTQIIQRVLQLAKEKFALIPQEKEYSIKGLPQITVGSEMEYHNILAKKITLLVGFDYFLKEAPKYGFRGSKLAEVQRKYEEVKDWIEQKLKIDPNIIIKNGLLHGLELQNLERCELELLQEQPLFFQKTSSESFLRVAASFGSLMPVREIYCHEVVTLPSLNPTLPLHEFGILYQSEVTALGTSFHFRFLGFDFQKVYPYVTDGLLLGFGSGLLDPEKKLTPFLYESVPKSYNNGEWYIPFHLRIESDSKSSATFLSYPNQVQHGLSQSGFELRNLPHIVSKQEFEKLEVFIEFKYWLIQVSIAVVAKRNEESLLSLQQKNLAELAESFFIQVDQIMRDFKITLSSRESRLKKGGTMAGLKENNPYLQDLQSVRKKAKANPRFEAQLLDMITTFVQNAKKACV